MNRPTEEASVLQVGGSKPPQELEVNTKDERVKGHRILVSLCAVYVLLHLLSLNFYPLDAWTQRILHLCGGLALGTFLFSGGVVRTASVKISTASSMLGFLGLLGALGAFGAYFVADINSGNPQELNIFMWLVSISAICTIGGGWLAQATGWRTGWRWGDFAFVALCVVVGFYLLDNLDALQFRAGVFPIVADAVISTIAIALLLEITRRTSGLAMVIIALIFVGYSFIGPWMPGLLQHNGYEYSRLITYLITDNGVLGPVLGVSSTYLILFIVFAALLSASGAGDYFVRLAFALAGHARGGPAKVAVIASGLMGTINGSSAGNVVSTGAFTIPLMKRVGYTPTVSGAIEAAASSGGQILPPIMGAGAFIMADITGIPYTDIILAAAIPGVLYFLSVYFMVDFEAAKNGMKGLPKDQLPDRKVLIKQLYLFAPLVMLIGSLIMGYSVIRAGTISGLSVIAVSWIGLSKMGPTRIYHALAVAAKMVIPLLAICATAGVVVGVIGITGIGLRFSTILLGVAESSQLIALFMTMVICVILGMGMPTTAAYAVAASVVAPGLIQLGIEPLVAHFFVFFFAVMSAITPPVALAAFAGAAISGANSMQTAVQSFKIGIAAFLVPFVFAFSPSLLMQGDTKQIVISAITACVGIYMLTASVQGWFVHKVGFFLRGVLLVASILMIMDGYVFDGIGATLVILLYIIQKKKSHLYLSKGA